MTPSNSPNDRRDVPTIVFAFDRDWTVDVNPHPSKEAVPLEWVCHLAHETDHPVYAIGNQDLAEEAAIPGVVDVVDRHPDDRDRWLGEKGPDGRYERFPDRRERLALVADLHPEASGYVVVDDIDLSDVEGWDHYHAWEFVPAVERGEIHPDLPWVRESVTDGGRPGTDDETGESAETPRRSDATVVPVGSRDLYLGDRRAADPDLHDRTFGHVVSLTRRPCPLTTHHHPLIDGPGNEFEDFEAAVDRTRNALATDQEDPVLVHCAAGISRSSTVITTAVAAEEGRAFDDVLAELRNFRERARPHPALRALAREYLDEEIPPDEAEARDRPRETHESLIDHLEAMTSGEDPYYVDAADQEGTDSEADSDADTVRERPARNTNDDTTDRHREG